MAKLKVNAEAVIVTSTLKLGLIKKLAKFRPSDLKVRDENDNEIYAIAAGNTPAFSEYGATLTGENADGFATATLQIPTGINAADKRNYVRDTFGKALLALNMFEDIIAENAAELDADLATVEANIDVEA